MLSKHIIVAVAAMAAGLAGASIGSASAFPVQPAPAVSAETSSLLTDVRHRDNRVHRYDNNYNRRYDRRRHGMRCGNWSNNCRYRYGGYYYENPWWLLPMVGVGIGIGAAGAYDNGYYDGGGYGRRHVQWCLDRYRSYNPRNNTWVSYSGYARQCISPYGP